MTIIAQPTPAESIDYDWLLVELTRNSGNRTDLAAKLPNYVRMAELRLNTDLASREQDTSATLSTVAATATVSLPADFISLRSLASPDGGTLDYLTTEQLDARYSTEDTAEPRSYTISGSTLLLAPVPDAAYALTLRYRATLLPLIDNGANWLLTNHPDAYVCGAMIYVCRYTKNRADLPVWEAGYADAVRAINASTWNAPGPLVARSDVKPV